LRAPAFPEFEIAAARCFDMPLRFSASYAFGRLMELRGMQASCRVRRNE